MKIVYFISLVLIASFIMQPQLCASGAHKPKTALTTDQSSPGGLYFPTITNWQGFQLNFSGQPITLGFIPEKKYDAAALLIGFPVIGHYRGAEYNFKKRLALIQFNPQDAAKIIPDTVQAAFAQQLKISAKELPQKLAQLDVRFNAIIVGTAIDPQYDSPDSSYNLAYHFWGGLWHKNIQDIVQFYVENFELGIFKPNGVMPKDLKLEALIPFNVSWHAPEHMSPDNARIIIEKERNFAAVWAAALSPDKKHVSITLFLIAHTPAAELFIAQALHNAQNILELKLEIDKKLMNNKNLFKPADIKAVQDWINTVFQIADHELYNTLFTPTASPKQEIQQPLEELFSLRRELHNLSSI